MSRRRLALHEGTISIPGMHVPTLIARKREGEELSSAEIGHLVDGYVSGEVADYQMSAFAMAVFSKG